jgi:hypothetical protein
MFFSETGNTCSTKLLQCFSNKDTSKSDIDLVNVWKGFEKMDGVNLKRRPQSNM